MDIASLGHKYTGRYNDLENQVWYDKDTGEIIEIYDPPTGRTDAIAMQHDIHYSVCGDNKKCKHEADQKMVKSLDAVPKKERQWRHWLARNVINTKQKIRLGVSKKRKKLPSWHLDPLPTAAVVACYCVLLVEMQQFSKWNGGYRYVLMVLDLFSKYGWIVPLKDKKGETVTQAFYSRPSSMRAVNHNIYGLIKGRNIITNTKELLKNYNITLHSTENEEKSSICERWNHTIKTKMWKQFTQHLSTLPKILKQYNNTRHSSIKMTLVEASTKKNESIVYFNLW